MSLPVDQLESTLNRMAYGRELKGALLMKSPASVPYRQPLLDPTCTHKLFHQSGVQVDLWKDENAAEIVEHATDVQLAGRTVRVAEPHNLIAMKLCARRLKDDYDVAQIVQNTPIEEKRIQKQVTPEQFVHYLEIKTRE